MIDILNFFLFGSFYCETNNKSLAMGKYTDCFFTDNGLGINVNEDCLVEQFLDDVKRNFYVDLDINPIIIDNNYLLRESKIYIFNDNDIKYILSTYHSKFLIMRVNDIDELRQEVIIKCEENDRYKIFETITDLNTNYMSCDFYEEQGEANISKKQALQLAQQLLDELLECKFILENKFCSKVYNMFKVLNLISSKNYYPAIGDEIITLFAKYQKYDNSMNFDNFSIVLNDT